MNARKIAEDVTTKTCHCFERPGDVDAKERAVPVAEYRQGEPRFACGRSEEMTLRLRLLPIRGQITVAKILIVLKIPLMTAIV